MAAAAASTSEWALVERGLAWIKPTSAVLTWACDLLAAASAERSLFRVSSSEAAGLRPLAKQLLDALELDLPAGEVGLGPSDAGPDLDELRLGAGDVGLGHLRPRPRPACAWRSPARPRPASA